MSELQERWEAYGWPWFVSGPGPERGVNFKARGDLLKYEWQAIGDLDVPSRFVAIFTKRSITIEMLIIVEDGRAKCKKINFEDTSAVTTQMLRSVPIDTWVDHACTRIIDALPDPQQWRSSQEYAERERALKSKRRQVINAELIEDVARIYREAVTNGEPPIKAINAEYQTASDSTIRRWVATARSDEYRLLPKAGKGRRAI